MANLSKIKAKIESNNDIGKITNAMQLVAAAKLRKIGKRVLSVQQYVSEVYSAFNEIINQVEESIFLDNNEKKHKKTLWVVINSNLGLCGGYNNNINKLVMNNIKSDDEIFAIGLKSINFYNSKKIKIKNQKTNIDVNFSLSDAIEFGKDIVTYFINNEFNEIKIAYTKFINNMTFEPTILTLFPIEKQKVNKSKLDIDFDPSPKKVLDAAINLYLSAILYGTIIESQVSEQASRRIAMENATNNGKELSDKLLLQYNQKRQSAITQEITEIISGANAQKR